MASTALSPAGRRRRQVALCVLSVLFAGYLLYWFMFALDMERMEAVDQWGKMHGVSLDFVSPGGRIYVAPGRVTHPSDYTP